MNRRGRPSKLAAWLLALGPLSPLALADPYPAQPVHLVVGTSGGAQDIVARLIAQSLAQRTGQPFIVDVRPGAGSMIAAEAVARSPADGYTLLFLGVPNAIDAALHERSPTDSLRGIVPVASLLRMPEILVVNASLPVKTIPELIAYARANPGKLNFASPGNGTGPHMSGELFRMLAGIEIVHVPYRGGGPAINDLLGGQVQMMFIAPVVAMSHVEAGRLRVLGISSAHRSALLPDVPAIGEFLAGFESGGFFGIGAPRGTPPEIVERLNGDINAALNDPAVAAQLARMGATALPGSPADFAGLLARETEKWARVIRFAGIKLD
jgi:tripartite-type tricarboxylate transporter receptor subunit TctC